MVEKNESNKTESRSRRQPRQLINKRVASIDYSPFMTRPFYPISSKLLPNLPFSIPHLNFHLIIFFLTFHFNSPAFASTPASASACPFISSPYSQTKQNQTQNNFSAFLSFTNKNMWKLQSSSDTLKHHHPLFNFYSDRVSSEFMDEKRTQTSSDCITAQTYASSRWCPTPEQLRSLEEFYKRGIRTPSTYQIQQITAQLRRFGKIEGKNVFYWFQNHKARERQKIRRKLSVGSVMLTHHDQSKQLQGKPSKDVEEVQKNWALTSLQEGVSIGRADTTEGERDGWIQLLLQKKDINRINNGISPSRYSHVTIDSHLLTSHSSVEEDHHRLESQRPKKTLELFPVHGDEKANEGPVQFYEFL